MPNHPHQLTRHTKFLHKTVIIIDGKILILKRPTNAHSRPGKWDLPGGNSEWPVGLKDSSDFSNQEDRFQKNIFQDLHQQDISREIEEETGLMVSSDQFGVSNMVYFSSFFDSEKQIYTIICGWFVNELAGNKTSNLDIATQLNSNKNLFPKILISNEHTEFVWVSQNELDKYDFGFEFLREIIKNGYLRISL